MSGLFTIFNVANRGMSTQQRAINVTSHNIANANTAGYSRQRAVIETTRPFGMPSLNNTAEPGQIGTGSQVSQIERVRDSFLDYQVRNETSTYGEFSARDKFLGEIEGIFNEPSDTGISTLIGKFFDSWNVLASNAQSSNSRTIVVQQAAALADGLNHTSTQLEKLKENVQETIGNTVFEVNDILNQINGLNQQIIGVKVAGQMPNDLMDRRDQLLDTLSSKFNIKVDKKNFEGYDIEPMFPSGESKIDDATLIKATPNYQVKRLSYVDDISNITNTTAADGTTTYSAKVTYYKLGNKASESNRAEIQLDGLTKDQLDSLSNGRVIWTGPKGEPLTDQPAGDVVFKAPGGELEGYRTVQADIENYMDQLNKVAKALAFSVNALHSGVDGTDPTKKDYTPFFVNSDTADKLYDMSGTKHVLYNGSDTTKLDQVLADEKNITAANISVNKQLIDDVMLVKTRLNDDQFALATANNIDGNTDGSRALAIAQLRNKLMKIQDVGSGIIARGDMFAAGNNSITKNTTGVEFVSDPNGMKVDNYFKDVIDRLGVQGGEAKRMVKNQETLLESFQQTRESVSGVSIDEEMANLIQYQHAYQANAKVISTVDELLDVVINGLKR